MQKPAKTLPPFHVGFPTERQPRCPTHSLPSASKDEAKNAATIHHDLVKQRTDLFGSPYICCINTSKKNSARMPTQAVWLDYN